MIYSERLNTSKNKIGKIFIRGVDWIGSLVLATPVYKNIRHNFPDARIVVGIRDWSKKLIENSPYVDEILVYGPHTIADRLEFVKRLKKEKFDLSILLSGSFESALTSFLAGIKCRVGYPHDFRGFLLTHKIRQHEKKHYVEYLLDILRGIGLEITDKKPELWLSKESLDFADNIFHKYKSGNEKIVIGIGHGVLGEKSRCWPEENYAELIKLLVNNLGAKVILFGSENDISSANRIMSLVDTEIIDLTGKTSITGFAACVKKCNLYVTNDTGGMHVAVAGGTNVIALFGPTHPDAWGPYNADNSWVIHKKIKCSPCLYRKMKRCKSNICMREISVKDVFDKIQSVL